MKKYNFRLPDNLADQLKSESDKLGVNPSTMLRMILSQRYGQIAPEPIQPTEIKKDAVKRPLNDRATMYKDANGVWKFR